ncbi:hypothetical protein Tco_1158379, partial [Tanacetum coccineum]
MNSFWPTRSALSMLKSLERFWISVQELKVKNSMRYKMMMLPSPSSLTLATKPELRTASESAAEEEVARQVHATHARIVTNSEPEHAKKKTDNKSIRGVVIQDTSSAPKPKLATSKLKLKGVQYLFHEEQEAMNITQALKESKKTSRRQPGTRGSNEGTSISLGVPDESTFVPATSSEGTEYQGDDEEVDWIDSDDDEEKKDDNDDDKSIDLEKTEDEEIDDEFVHNGEYVQTDDKETDNEFVQGDEQVNDDEDEEMTNVEVEDSGKGDAEISDVAKEDSPSELTIPVLVISEPSVLTPIPETPSLAPTTTLLPPSSVSTIPPVPHQTIAPIPTPPITTDAPTITTDVLESDSLSVVQLRVAKLEKDVSELKKIDHSPKALRMKMPWDKGVADIVKNHKRQHDDDDDDDEDHSAGPNQGKKTKRQRTKESESFKKPPTTKETPKDKTPSKGSKTSKTASAKESVEELIAEVAMDDAVNTTGEDVVSDDDQPQNILEPNIYKTSNQDWFKQPPTPPTLNLKWNKHQVVLFELEQPWFNQMVSATKDPLTFNDLMATLIDFSKYVLNQLKSHQGHLTVAIDYFFNNDLEYLKTSYPEKMYTTSITKTKAARYEIVGIEDMTPTLWGTIKHAYDKDAAKGIKHWGERRKLCVKKLHGYGYLQEVVVKRADRQLYKYKEGDFVDLHLSNIKDMLILTVQHKLFHFNESDIVDIIVALRMFTRSLIIKRHVEDIQLGVESYQKKLNITAPQQTFPKIEFKELYTPSYKPPG